MLRWVRRVLLPFKTMRHNIGPSRKNIEELECYSFPDIHMFECLIQLRSTI